MECTERNLIWRAFGPSISRNLITRVLTFYQVKNLSKPVGGGTAWGGGWPWGTGGAFDWSCSPGGGDIWIFLRQHGDINLTPDSDERDWYRSDISPSCMRRTVWKSWMSKMRMRASESWVNLTVLSSHFILFKKFDSKLIFWKMSNPTSCLASPCRLYIDKCINLMQSMVLSKIILTFKLMSPSLHNLWYHQLFALMLYTCICDIMMVCLGIFDSREVCLPHYHQRTHQSVIGQRGQAHSAVSNKTWIC